MRNRHTRRAWWHDYRSKGIYFITINKRQGSPDFGVLDGNWHIPVGIPGSPFIRLSVEGKEISSALTRISEIFPYSRLLQYAIMPDHVHILIQIHERLPMELGFYVSKFKNYLRLRKSSVLFEKGFNDQIVTKDRNLNQIIQYIRENPYRLAVRKAKPENFIRNDNIIIKGKRYSGYGNIFLLKNPFRDAVVIHRRYSETQKMELKRRWLHNAISGGVLVSPFISKEEKEVWTEAAKYGGSVILITDEPLPPPPYKPSGKNFHLCEKGELLILAPYESLPAKEAQMDSPDISNKWIASKERRKALLAEGRPVEKKKPISREACLRMNELAEYICSVKFNSH